MTLQSRDGAVAQPEHFTGVDVRGRSQPSAAGLAFNIALVDNQIGNLVQHFGFLAHFQVHFSISQ